MKGDAYFQFPLCALTLAGRPSEVARHITSYSAVAAGVTELGKLSREKREEACRKYGLRAEERDSWELAAHLGADACRVTLGAVEDTLGRYRAMTGHVKNFEAKHGRSPRVRVKTDLVFEVRDGGRMSWREFRVLAGIYSVIGNKPFPVAIPQSMIDARHCGFSSPSAKAAALAAGDELEPLTPKQLRGTIEKLWLLKWFARVTPDPHGRATYYSHRLTEDQMIEEIFERRTYKTRFMEAAREKARQLKARLDALKPQRSPQPTPVPAVEAAIPTEDAPAPEVPESAGEGRREGQPGAAQGLREGNAEASHGHHEGTGEGTKRAPLIETPSMETRLIETPLSQTHPIETQSDRKSVNETADAAVDEGELPEKGNFRFPDVFKKKPPAKVIEKPRWHRWCRFIRQEYSSLHGDIVPDWEMAGSVHEKFAEWQAKLEAHEGGELPSSKSVAA